MATKAIDVKSKITNLKLQMKSPQSQLLPLLIHFALDFLACAVLPRPAPVEAFGFPFTRPVDPHLRAISRFSGSMIEHIDRAQHKLDIAFRVDVIEYFPGDFSRVLHIYLFINDHDAFGKHGLSQSPDCVHY